MHSRVKTWLPIFDNDERAAKSTGVGGDEDPVPAVVLIDGNELPDPTPPPEVLQVRHELPRPPVDAEQVAVQEDEVVAHVVQLLARHRVRVLHTEAVAELPQGGLVLAGGHVGQQREVLHEAALLALRGVRGAEHAPLRGLQGARAGHLAALLEVRAHAHHGAQAGHVGEARQDLGDARFLHLVSLDVPVAGRDCVHHRLREARSVRPQIEHVRIRRVISLLRRALLMPLTQCNVRLLLELGIHAFDLILEEEGHELAGELEALVAVVVAVVDQPLVVHRVDQPPDHETEVTDLGGKVVVRALDVREELLAEDLHRVHGLRRLPGVLGLELGAEVVQGTLLREDVPLVHLLQRGHEAVQVPALDADHLDDLHVALHSQGLHDDGHGHEVQEGRVLEVEALLPCRGVQAENRPALVVPGLRGADRLEDLLGVVLHDDAVRQGLLLHHEHALHALDDEVAPGVVGALAVLHHLGLALAVEDAEAAPQHDRQVPDLHLPLLLREVALPVHDVDPNGCGVGEVPEAARLGRGLDHGHVLLLGRLADVDVLVPEEPLRIGVAPDQNVALRTHDFLEFERHQVVVGINVLGH
mmetsp:Transcript_82902/g.243053  ORF Transcript_82902/g.243053 Transcript_82902/m.243053 type:complete len:586 (+) Transcript_82902:1742-3499(+)